MAIPIFLWLTLLLYAFYFAGHLFDLLANVPNWKSGDPADVQRYRAFYHQRTPRNYFAPLVLGTPGISLLTLILIWPLGSPLKFYLLTAFLISVIGLLMTLRLFVPINQYIFASGEYDAGKLKRLVSRWVSLDYLRVFLLAVGLLAAILGLDAYYGIV